jgi:hypothetical protein
MTIYAERFCVNRQELNASSQRSALYLAVACGGLMMMTTHHHHHESFNVPTAGAQAFLMNYNKENGPVRVGGC